MGMVITVAIVTKSLCTISLARNAASDPSRAFAAPSDIIVSYCSEPMTDRRIAGSATPIEPMRATSPTPIPIAGSMENVTEVEMTFFILPISILSAFALRIATIM